MKNALDTQVFQDNLDLTLENILETLDHIKLIKITRQKYNTKKGEILEKTESDTYGDFYNLYLADDLQIGEQLQIIDLLNKKFDLEKYGKMNEIITKVKVMGGIVLKIKGKKDGEEYLEELSKKYNFNNNFIEKINAQQIKPTRITKDFVRSIQSQTGTENFKKAKEADFEVGTSELAKVFSEEFDLTFFRKSINMLRLTMETITQAEQQAIIQYCEKNKFKKTKDKDGKITYKKGDEKVVLRTDIAHLDTQAQKLRDKIGIDTLKIELEQVRKTGSKEEIAEKEIQATNTVLEALFEYPGIISKNEYGYQPIQILQYKEIYCVGFCLLGHAFLSELGIFHKGLDNRNHGALEINIMGKKYYFDATFSKKILEFEYGEKIENYFRLNPKIGKFPIIFGYPGNIEKILFSQILHNKDVNKNTSL